MFQHLSHGKEGALSTFNSNTETTILRLVYILLPLLIRLCVFGKQSKFPKSISKRSSRLENLTTVDCLLSKRGPYARIHRNSLESEELFYAHFGDMNVSARETSTADKIVSNFGYPKSRKKCYTSDATMGMNSMTKGLTLEYLINYAFKGGSPRQLRQKEWLENH